MEQFGFRKHSNCEMALISSLDKWQDDIGKGLIVGTLLLDLSKAFDAISHQLLLSKLQSINSCRGGNNVSPQLKGHPHGRVSL
jgi:hypothetical protein